MFYGTLKEQVDRKLERGENVICDVDVKGALNIKRCYGSGAISLFIQPPSIEELRRRLENRHTDLPEMIEKRLARASYELSFASQFDYVVINDDLNTACRETQQWVETFLAQ